MKRTKLSAWLLTVVVFLISLGDLLGRRAAREP